MYNVFDTEIFGVILTILFFNIGIYIQKKTNKPIFNPLLIAILGIILFLSITKIPYESYKLGGDRINFFLGPVTIVLAVPLYKQFDLFKKYLLEILIGISCGVVVSFISVKLIGHFTNADVDIIPKSITTPMGISLTKTLSGVEAITVVSIILTGILGAIISPIIFKIGKINNPVAKGIALGTSAHALGTTKALEMGEVEGAMSGLSIGISGIITVILIPIIINFM